VAALVLVGGLGLILAPWLTRLVASADTDRRDRIRAEERADIAAHLHDSVLQTLTLIQNRASDPQLTAALAHQQERELRRWLYGAGERSDLPVSFRTALEQVAAEVEDQYLKIVECIVVGDAEMSPAAVGAVAAAREAIVNAAKFAEIPMISVYAEVDDVRMSVFVRDRGVGFELASIPDDRHGVSDSICGRVERLGGTAVVRSTPGAGTEVRIQVPR
jgi:signal transduction histidine kinase